MIRCLSVHAEQHRADDRYYYRMRDEEPGGDLEKAARFWYLNRTCYNGLYRVNKQGQFNVPKGDYRHPKICDARGIRRANRVLQKADISVGDFESICPAEGDFVYCDPPYDETFTAYTPHGFGHEDQRRLRNAILCWHSRGALVMASNADTPFIRTLYGEPPFRVHEVVARYSVSRNGQQRQKTSGLLITTYIQEGP